MLTGRELNAVRKLSNEIQALILGLGPLAELASKNLISVARLVDPQTLINFIDGRLNTIPMENRALQIYAYLHLKRENSTYTPHESYVAALEMLDDRVTEDVRLVRNGQPEGVKISHFGAEVQDLLRPKTEL